MTDSIYKNVLESLPLFPLSEMAKDTPEEENIIIEPYIEQGDLIILGQHRLLCANCHDSGNLDRLIDGNKIHCVFADPPYGMGLRADYTSMNRSTSKHLKHKNIIGDNALYDPTFLLEYFANVKEIFLWGANYYANKIPVEFKKHSWLVWDKRIEDGRLDYSHLNFTTSEFELCWSKNKHRQRMLRFLQFGYICSQFEPQGSRKRIHPTQKPVRMITYCLEQFLKETDVNICDPYLGSGSTLIACDMLEKTCFGIEIDSTYCEKIIARWIEYRHSDMSIFIIRDGHRYSLRELNPIKYNTI